ncbi:aspartic peptidase domain-containing protein [Protomyces lactucae-debilis]|uniref:Aspartic peptidase domain-containing protein n=1 Tax=Protomyces lactucae-debilis TaxID=2754530 RepID=A0A1Y2FMB0_PROLT|nr:aspartic peptidase domain-containing protein [Protomyces lactucae-debilis]ORY85078.1 aspartic peptidase domain-containing protein [Protomyces lactucae-debilis]
MIATLLALAAALSTAAAGLSADNVVSSPDMYIRVPLTKQDTVLGTTTAMRKRQAQPFANGSLTITPRYSSYTANLTVGSPGQTLQLILDTGSPLTWANAANISNFVPGDTPAQAARRGQRTTICQQASCFNPNASSTNTVPGNSSVFQIAYVDGTTSIGRVVQDTGTFLGLTDTTFEFGLVEYSYSPGSLEPIGGIIGMSPQAPVQGFSSIAGALQQQAASIYTPQTIQQQLKNAGQILTEAFSLFLDDEYSGELLLSGVDAGRYSGPLIMVPIVDDATELGSRFSVSLAALGINNSSTTVAPSTALAPTLDSGTTSTYIPADLLAAIARGLGANVIDTSSGSLMALPCTQTTNQTIDWYFANNAKIRIPLAAMLDGVYPSAAGSSFGFPGRQVCVVSLFGVQPTADASYILGDSFLRSAYVVYDEPNGLIGLAQSAYDGVSQISPIQPGAFGVPGAVYNRSSPGAAAVASIPSISRTVILGATSVQRSGAGGTGTPAAAAGGAGSATTTSRAAGMSLSKQAPLQRRMHGWEAGLLASLVGAVCMGLAL